MTGFVFCPRCRGTGEDRVPGHNTNPFSGVTVHDPQEDACYPCPRCNGTGAVPVPYRDREHFDRVQDERAERLYDEQSSSALPVGPHIEHGDVLALSSRQRGRGLRVASAEPSGATDVAAPRGATRRAA